MGAHPTVIPDADDCGLRHRGMKHDQILDLDRRHPFTAGLDDIFQAIGDLQVAVAVDHPNIVGVQVSVGPEQLKLPVFEITLVAQGARTTISPAVLPS